MEEKLTRLFHDELVQSKHLNVDLKCAFITGSYAYPEFLHASSDIDITYIVENVFPKSLEISEKDVAFVEINEQETIVEYSIYSVDKYATMLREGDLVVAYALIRGFRVIDDSDAYVDSFYALAKKRFRSIYDVFIEKYQDSLDVDYEIRKNSLYINEIIASFNIDRLDGNHVIYHVKLGFLLRVIVVNYYRLRLICDDARNKEVKFIYIVHYIMINNEKSFRIFDIEKYEIEPKTRLLINWINENFNSVLKEKGRIDYQALNSMWEAVYQRFFCELSKEKKSSD